MSTNGHGRRDVDVLLASALATGATYEEAGRIAGVSKSTVKRRMGSEAFRQRVAEERVGLIDTLRGQLLAAAPQAVATLRELSASGESDSVRLGAARAVLDLSLGRRRGFDLVQGKEVERLVGDVADAAARRLPDGQMIDFLREIEGLAGGR
jgi:uncharacterized protein (DUF3084 family)